MQGRLVHFDDNCILPKTDPAWEKEHETSVLGVVGLIRAADNHRPKRKKPLDFHAKSEILKEIRTHLWDFAFRPPVPGPRPYGSVVGAMLA